MTGLAMGGLPSSDLERPLAIALDFQRAICDPARLLRHRGVLWRFYVSLCQHDFVLKWSNQGRQRFQRRLQANMRRGTGSSLAGTWLPYATIEEAREAAREMLRDDRVLRVTIVEDAVPPRFVEWVNR